MHSKLDVHYVWLVDVKVAVYVTITGDSELLLDILELHDVCDRSLIEPYFFVVFDIRLLVGFYIASIFFHSHGVFAFPDLGDYVLVSK